jgi:hypothetical protein
MVTVRVTSEIKIDLDQLLNGVTQLETPDLEAFVNQVSLILAQRRVASLPEGETTLLQKINLELPETTRYRYDGLQRKSQAEILTPEEHEELLSLIDRVEQADAERLEALLELAQLRQISLPELMVQLGIQSPPIHG